MSAPALAPTDLLTLGELIAAANVVYRAAYAAAEHNPSAKQISLAASALRKRDALLDQWPRG